jgi:hypothetical protein
MGSEPKLLEIVRAGHPGRRFTDLLNGREQQTDENRDDGDHHQ